MAEYTTEAIEAMRSWASDIEWRDIDDVSELTPEEIVELVTENYEGTIEQFMIAEDIDDYLVVESESLSELERIMGASNGLNIDEDRQALEVLSRDEEIDVDVDIDEHSLEH